MRLSTPRWNITSPMSLDSVYALYGALADAATQADCAALFRSFIAPFGFDTYACGEFDLRDRTRAVFYIIDWPDDWREFYIGSGLIHHDPLLDALAGTTKPFTWNDLRRARKLPKVGKEALDRIAVAGWSEGLVVPIPTSGNRLGLVSLVGHRAVEDTARGALVLASMCLHQATRARAGREGFAQPPLGLTKRELEVLSLVATGGSDARIGATLGVSTWTAHEYVENAKRKLGARTRAEMVALAAALGVIEI